MQRSEPPSVYLAIVQFVPSAKLIVMTGDNTAVRHLDAVNATLLIGRTPLVGTIIELHIGDIFVILVVGCQQFCNHKLCKIFPSHSINHCGVRLELRYCFITEKLRQKEFTFYETDYFAYGNRTRSSRDVLGQRKGRKDSKVHNCASNYSDFLRSTRLKDAHRPQAGQ